MHSGYPEESQHMDFVGHLEELRRRILTYLAVLGVLSAAFFTAGDALMRAVRRPADPYVRDLIFIAPAEALMAYLKVVLLAGFVVSFPVLLFEIWAFIASAVPRARRKRILFWMAGILILFVAGLSFSYFLALPAALKFLLNFGNSVASAEITLGKYVSFFLAVMFAGGILFEIPVVIGLLSDLGIVNAKTLREKRPYALVLILIVAAVVTPTQDAVNLLLFALPMALLYEAGIGLSVLMEKGKRKPVGPETQ